MPATKKRKVTEVRYQCSICMSNRISSRFPDITPTETCKHLIGVCTICMRDYIDAQLEHTIFDGSIKCPECDEQMLADDIEAVGRKASSKRFKILDDRRRHNTEPDFHWCLNPKCTSGQTYVIPTIAKEESDVVIKSETTETTATKAAKGSERPIKVKVEDKENDVEKTSSKSEKGVKSEEESDLPSQSLEPFRCKACKKEYCMVCEVPWHTGKTCDEVRKALHKAEDKKSKAKVDKISKPCPHCKVRTERDGGCPHMYCVKCHKDWCFICGTGFTAGSCSCRRASAMPAALAQGLQGAAHDPVAAGVAALQGRIAGVIHRVQGIMNGREDDF